MPVLITKSCQMFQWTLTRSDQYFYSLLRIGMEYIKVILQNGRMVGAILIGETDLEVSNV